MSTPTLFENNNALANSDLFKSLQDSNENLTGGTKPKTERRRISLNGNKFREYVNGEQINVSKEDNINIVIVDSAKLHRTYYEGTYDPKNAAPPKCWSDDTNTPSQNVPKEDRQASRCMDCPKNVKGSGQGDTKACRIGQRLAVAVETDLTKVYQLNLSGTSIFGDPENGNMRLQAYARWLSANNAPAIAVMTNMYFDSDSSVPKVFFKGLRALNENELQAVVALKDRPETKQALGLTVAQTDGVQEIPFVEKKEEPVKAVAAPVEDEPVDEPKKVVKKTAPKPEEDSDLSAIIDNWDD